MELNEAQQILNKKGYKLVESFELTDEIIDAAKDILMGENYGYPYESVEAAFEYQNSWIDNLEGNTPEDVASTVSDFLDNLSDDELEEIGAI